MYDTSVNESGMTACWVNVLHFPFIDYMNETVSSVSILKAIQISTGKPSQLSTVGTNGSVSMSIFNAQIFTG